MGSKKFYPKFRCEGVFMFLNFHGFEGPLKFTQIPHLDESCRIGDIPKIPSQGRLERALAAKHYRRSQALLQELGQAVPEALRQSKQKWRNLNLLGQWKRTRGPWLLWTRLRGYHTLGCLGYRDFHSSWKLHGVAIDQADQWNVVRSCVAHFPKRLCHIRFRRRVTETGSDRT